MAVGRFIIGLNAGSAAMIILCRVRQNMALSNLSWIVGMWEWEVNIGWDGSHVRCYLTWTW